MRIIIRSLTAILILQNICNAFQPISFVGRSKAWSQASTLKGRSILSMSPAESEVAAFASNQLDTVASSATSSPVIQGLSPEANVAVFIIGIIPFLWATYEFWSRIAVGASFGTGADSIQIRPSTRTIGKDGEPLKSRGQQVLGDGALVVAYVLFAIAIGSVSIAIYSVVSSPLPTL